MFIKDRHIRNFTAPSAWPDHLHVSKFPPRHYWQEERQEGNSEVSKDMNMELWDKYTLAVKERFPNAHVLLQLPDFYSPILRLYYDVK
jgi:hypothetical protein